MGSCRLRVNVGGLYKLFHPYKVLFVIFFGVLDEHLHFATGPKHLYWLCL